jgi:hypothetical protein
MATGSRDTSFLENSEGIIIADLLPKSMDTIAPTMLRSHFSSTDIGIDRSNV